MKIVHIVFERPQRHGSGGDLRNLAVFASLSRIGSCSSICVQDAYSAQSKYPNRKLSFIEADLPPSLVRQIADQAMRQKPDLIVIDGMYLADIARHLAREGCRVILDMHNVESVLRKEMDQVRYGWRAGLLHGKRWRAAEQAEREVIEIVDQVWVCSATDAALVRKLGAGDTAVTIVPNPIPDWCYKAAPKAVSGLSAPRILFVGHLGYPPNVVAAKRLLDRIFPQIRKVLPEATMQLCGRTPKKRLIKAASKAEGVTLIANPQELTTYYNHATVVLVPLTEGGGTRLKVLEAMALGLPVVATAKAVEGLAVTPGQTFLLAETDAAFVEAVQRLSAEPKLAMQLADAGLRYVYDHHSPAAIDTATANGTASFAQNNRRKIMGQ
ncbi:glycosyltransferase family 4 protein [Loktanella sp. 5RATIMAR09]|uniref:glycosyltransferase family 4 protein n=1 Tax=Loktanella sp. 5RATIMAR09 TaxID=1225655 RepID=UPI0006EBC453|nr:glycosyltransferase family 4 protein [Loktanella sp. 5RATIMAR09]